MPYFLYQGQLVCGQEAELEGEEANHASRSRRLRQGEQFEVQDIHPQRFLARVLNKSRNNVKFMVEKVLESPPESVLKLELWQALPTEKSLEFILQKGTELGVSRFVLFPGRYTQGLRHQPKQEDSIQRWHRICKEACKQSGRLLFPKVSAYLSLDDAFVKNPLQGEGWMLCTEDQKIQGFPEHRLQRLHLKLLIGPEGGWHQDEILNAEQREWKPVGLGPRIMRSETAAVSALSILQYFYGDMGKHSQTSFKN